MSSKLRLSVLDQSVARAGRPQDESIRATVALAEHCEALGYHRFWVSEHHSLPTIVGTAPEVLMVEGRPCVAVLVPTAPVPVGGGLLFVPEHWVSPAALSVEAVTSLYVSMGVTAAQHLPVAAPEISRAPGA